MSPLSLQNLLGSSDGAATKFCTSLYRHAWGIEALCCLWVCCCEQKLCIVAGCHLWQVSSTHTYTDQQPASMGFSARNAHETTKHLARTAWWFVHNGDHLAMDMAWPWLQHRGLIWDQMWRRSHVQLYLSIEYIWVLDIYWVPTGQRALLAPNMGAKKNGLGCQKNGVGCPNNRARKPKQNQKSTRKSKCKPMGYQKNPNAIR